MSGPRAPWVADEVRQFFRFIAERHEIFHRRHLLKRPPPWTDDPLLQRLRLTNVYRELDRATRYLITRVLEPYRTDRRTAVFNVALFRAFVLPETFEALGAPLDPRQWDQKAARRVLKARQRAGHKIFTGAYMISNHGSRQNKIDLVTGQVTWIARHLDALLTDSLHAAGLEQVADVWRRAPGLGDFGTMEILIDLCYEHAPVLSFSLNQWVALGPGAWRGLCLLTGHTIPRRDALRYARELQHRQQEWFAWAGAELHGPVVSLDNIENCLCEYSKVRRAARGGHVKRRYVTPRPDEGLWDTLPREFTDRRYWLHQS